MATQDSELRTEVRAFGQYSTQDIDQSGLETATSRAKKHLINEANLDNPDWYNDITNEEALFWTTMLFSKVIVGDLDTKNFSVGGIKEGELLAKSDGEVTTWYRNYRKYRDRLAGKKYSHVRTASRTDESGSRNY